MLQKVLVIGGGVAGVHTAGELERYGYETIVVERSERIGGELPPGIKTLKNACLSKLSGSVGSFTAHVQTSAGPKEIHCGVVVVCTGTDRSCAGADIFDSDTVVDIADLNAAMAAFSNRNRPRCVGLVLDMKIEETKGSTRMALETALFLRDEYRCEVFIFCREVRVAAKQLENLLDRAKDTGVNIVTYQGNVKIQSCEDKVLVSVRDILLDTEISVACDIAAVSLFGLSSRADAELAGILGIRTDRAGQMQDNNIHLLPELTNRPGLFVVGACRGCYYVPQIVEDAKAAALGIHSLLSGKYLTVEAGAVVVDENKCALCLTCVRSCPHGAMIIDSEKGVAVSIPEACQRCGICVGECPAGAIELPDRDRGQDNVERSETHPVPGSPGSREIT